MGVRKIWWDARRIDFCNKFWFIWYKSYFFLLY